MAIFIILSLTVDVLALKEKKDNALQLFLYSGTELSLFTKPDSKVLGSADEAEKLFTPMFFVGMNIEFLLIDDRVNPFLDIKFGNSTIRSQGEAPSMESFQNLEESNALGFDAGLKIKVYKPKLYHLFLVGTYGGLIPTAGGAQKGFFNKYFAGIGAEISKGKVAGSYIHLGATKNDIIDDYFRAQIRVDVRVAELLFVSVAISNDLGDKPDDFRFMVGYQSRVLGF